MSQENKLLQKIDKALSKGNYSIAIENLNVLIQKQPSDSNLLLTRGEAHLRNEDFEKGLNDLAKVVEVDNKNIKALVNFSVALIRCNMQNDAKSVLEYVLELDPDNFDAYINLCNVYQSLGKSEDSLKMAARAIELRPDSSIAYNNLGTALGDLNMVKEAREALVIAHAIDPDYIATSINLGQLEVKLGNHTEAQILFEEILTFKNISPAQKDLVKYYLAYCYLHLGRISIGWDYYEYGNGALLPTAAMRSKRKFNQPQWKGEKLANKTLLVWREQGLGDEIEFATCLTDLLDFDVNVILECDTRMVNIYKRTFPSFTVRSESIRSDFYPLQEDFDFQIAVGSLPKLFRRDIESFNRNITPISILDASIDEFKNRLYKFKNKKKIGICWRSGVFSVGRNINYTALVDWTDLLRQDDFIFINLQYGECENELLAVESKLGISIIRWNDLDLKNDLENLCGLIKNLDAVVTVGTAVSSIAASCNITTYLLTRPTWLMLGQKDKYPWYDCVVPLVADQDSHVAELIKNIPKFIRK